ncbi:hypothetical protein SMICM17S_07472 [Streptomyces microflavus]
MQCGGNPGLLDHEQAVGVAGALLRVLGHVHSPETQCRVIGLLREQVQSLVGVFGADGHDVAGRPAADALGSEQAGTAVALAPGVGEQIPGLHRTRAALVRQQLRLEFADHAPVEELVVHVEQVLVHERVVAAHGPGEGHGPVLRRGEAGYVGQRGDRRFLRVARKDEHQAVGLAHRVGAHAAWRPAVALGQVGDLRDAAVAAVGPGVIAAAERLAVHDAHAQRHLPVGAPVLQRMDGTAPAAEERDALPGERGGGHPPAAHSP